MPHVAGKLDHENYCKFLVLLISHTRSAELGSNQLALSLLHTALLYALGMQPNKNQEK
jgi:hypothetical protein